MNRLAAHRCWKSVLDDLVNFTPDVPGPMERFQIDHRFTGFQLYLVESRGVGAICEMFHFEQIGARCQIKLRSLILGYVY